MTISELDDVPYWETTEYCEAQDELDTYNDPARLVMEYRIGEKQNTQQIAELKKALELACKYSFYYTKVIKFNDCGIEIDNYRDLMEFAINKAKEMIKNE